MPESPLQTEPLRVALGAQVIRRLPAGRYHVMSWLSRVSTRPFWTTLPADAGGYRFQCYLRDGIAREVCFAGQYEPQETAIVRTLLRPGHVFVDVGANWGYFTLMASHSVGDSGRVLAVEADPRIFELLRGNVEANDLNNVTLVHVAASHEEGVLDLEGCDQDGQNWGLSKVASAHGPRGAASYRVTARPLDAILHENGIEKVDLMKVDIEGAESFALDGMRETLASRRVDRILLELHPALLADHGIEASDVFDRLLASGYTPWSIDHSPQAVRRAAYAKQPDVRSFLERQERCDPTAPWPHILWTRSAESPLD